MRQHLSFVGIGKAAGGLPGSEPHSGNPTVWDRRRAYGNVNYGLVYTGTYRGNADTAKAGPTVARAVFLSRPRPRFALHGAQRALTQLEINIQDQSRIQARLDALKEEQRDLKKSESAGGQSG